MNFILKFIKVYYGFVNILIGLATLVFIVFALVVDLQSIAPFAMNLAFTSKLCIGFLIIGLIAIFVVNNFESITKSLKKHIGQL